MKKLIFLIALILYSYSNIAISQTETFSKVLYSDSNIIQVNSLTHSFDNGFVLVADNNYANGMIIKLDSVCNEIWAKEIINSNVTSTPNIEINNIVRTNDSCFIISGNAENPDTDNRDAICMKIDREGDTIWTTTIGGNEHKNIISSCLTNNSGILITGSASDGAGTRWIYIAMLDSDGNVLWVRKIEMGDHNCSGNSIKQLNDSSYLLTGYFSNFSPYEGYPFLINISETGQINWAKKYVTDELRGRCNDVVITETGLFLYIVMNTGSSFLHTDFEGNVLWNKSYNIYANNNVGIVTPKLHRTSDNSLIGIVGSEWEGGRMFKLDSAANLLWLNDLFLGTVNVLETNSGEYLAYGNGPLLGVKSIKTNYGHIGFIQMDSMGYGSECIYYGNGNIIEDSILCEPVSYTVLSDFTVSNIPIEINDESFILRDGCVDMIGEVREDGTTNELVIFPNPGCGIFNISMENHMQADLTIFNGFGQIVYENKVVNGTKIDLCAQTCGVYYYLFVTSDEKQYSGKLVIMD